MQFSLVEMVLKELGILTEVETNNGILYNVDNTVTTRLENSTIYLKAKQIKEESGF